MSPYRLHQDFCHAARHEPGLGRLAIAILAIEALYAIGLQLFDLVLGYIPAFSTLDIVFGDTWLGLATQLCGFGILALAVMLTVGVLYGRPPKTLFGPSQRVIYDLIRVFLATGGLLLLLEMLPPYWGDDGIVETRNLGFWLLGLLPALGVLTIQTGAEEILYRGFIQQQIAARFENPLIWLVLPNILFAQAHWANGSDFNTSAQYVIWAFCFGVAASDLTARTGSLGAAIGFHLANNAFAFFYFAEQNGPDSGFALYLYEPGTLDSAATTSEPILSAALMLELIGVWMLWMAARIILRR